MSDVTKIKTKSINYIEHKLKESILQLLLNYYKNKTPLSQLKFELFYNEIEKLNKLLDIYKSNEYNDTYEMLYDAWELECNDVVKFLNENGVKVNFKDEKNRSLLIEECKKGNESKVKFLIDIGADVNFMCRDYYQYNEDEDDDIDEYIRGENTPLITAILYNKDAIAKYLVEHGADVNINPKFRDYCKVPLIVAVSKRNLSMVKYLIEHGADVNSCFNDTDCTRDYCCYHYITPLIKAIEKENESIVKYLIEHGADVNYFDTSIYNCYTKGDEFTPLSTACEVGNESIIKCLIEHGADVNKKIKIFLFGSSDRLKDYTPLSLVCENGNEKMIKYLIDHGTDINVKLNVYKYKNYVASVLSTTNLLNVARESCDESIVKLLIEHGAIE